MPMYSQLLYKTDFYKKTVRFMLKKVRIREIKMILIGL